ncbi:MAG: acyl-ACP desaturase [Isosphaeraceae bacterium]
MELTESLQGHVEENLSLLASVEQAWQPTDYLPDLTAEDWSEQVSRFRDSARQVSSELLVVLVGNMVTEEALPNYSVSLNHIVRDMTGIDTTPWAQWLRGWTAEENRHGDLLNAYLRLTGRVDMRAVEKTVHHLIRNGFSPRTKGDNFAGMIYTAFQERATRITHGNVGRLAGAQGDENLARICRRIAGDEARHETFYTRMVAKAMEQDPERGVLAFRAMLRSIIAMPGRRMYDGHDPDLFDHFAIVSQRIGAYTALTYAQIIEHLVETWGIAQRSLSGKAAKAQDYLCQQAERYQYFADEIAENLSKQPHVPFAWVPGSRA